MPVTEYGQKVFAKLANPSVGEYFDKYFVFVDQEGCGIDDGPDVIPGRSWRLLTISDMSGAVMSHVCHRAGKTEARKLVLAEGSTTPEKYIASWRKSLAKPLDHPLLFAEIPVCEGTIVLPDPFNEAFDQEWTREKFAEFKSLFHPVGSWKEGTMKWSIPICTLEDLENYHSHMLTWCSYQQRGLAKWLTIKGNI